LGGDILIKLDKVKAFPNFLKLPKLLRFPKLLESEEVAGAGGGGVGLKTYTSSQPEARGSKN